MALFRLRPQESDCYLELWEQESLGWIPPGASEPGYKGAECSVVLVAHVTLYIAVTPARH